jgi:Coenzyme PQQ synthesis protein D (PqqD)
MSNLDQFNVALTTSPGVLVRPLGDEAVLLDATGGNYFALNPSGYLVWQHIQSGKLVPEIVAALVEKYAIAESQAQRDVSDVINALLEAKLIGRSAAPTAVQ